MNITVMIRRTSASLIIALMLCVSSIAGACDLSCSFAQQQSDCHALGAKRLTTAGAGMRMDDMAMDGMAMPEMAAGQDQIAVSAKAERTSGHPSIGAMGPCERQPCDNGLAVSARTSRMTTPRVHLILAPIEAPLAARASPIFNAARDDIATAFPRDGSPLSLSLRI
jgi:hypothetical protein